MITYAIYKTGCMEVPGDPDIFMKNDVLKKVLESEKAREDLITLFHDGVCIGSLGIETEKGYVDESETRMSLNDGEKGDLGFYGYLR